MKSMEIRRRLFGTTISGEKIYCFGGKNDSGNLDLVESFSLINEEWKQRKTSLKRKKWSRCHTQTLSLT